MMAPPLHVWLAARLVPLVRRVQTIVNNVHPIYKI